MANRQQRSNREKKKPKQNKPKKTEAGPSQVKETFRTKPLGKKADPEMGKR